VADAPVLRSIEHSKLEFSMAVKVRQDPHILAQMKALVAPPVARPIPTPAPAPAPPTKSRGMRNFFKSSPQKPKAPVAAPAPVPAAAPAWRPPHNLARYIRTDGTVARAFLHFNDVKEQCDTTLTELALPLIAERTGANGRPEAVPAGELIIRIFRLPPLPVPADTLPQSLEECSRALDNVRWHRTTYMEGTMTQNGADCSVSVSLARVAGGVLTRACSRGAGGCSGSSAGTSSRSAT
jgi:hypothetical protein